MSKRAKVIAAKAIRKIRALSERDADNLYRLKNGNPRSNPIVPDSALPGQARTVQQQIVRSGWPKPVTRIFYLVPALADRGKIPPERAGLSMSSKARGAKLLVTFDVDRMELVVTASSNLRDYYKEGGLSVIPSLESMIS